MYSSEDFSKIVYNSIKKIDFLKILNVIFMVMFTMMNIFYIVGYTVSNFYGIKVDGFSSVGLFAYIISLLAYGYYLSPYLSLRTFSLWIIGYVIYLMSSYLIFLSEFINKADFKPEQTFMRDFWEIRYLPTMLLVILIAILFRVLFNYWYIEELEFFELPPNIVLSGLLFNTIMCDSRVTEYFISNFKTFFETSGGQQLFNQLFSLLATLILFLGPICYFLIKSIDSILRNRSHFSLAVTFSLVFAIVFNYTLQMGVQGKEQLLGKYIFPGAILYQIIFLFIFFLLLYSLINRFLSATLIIIVLGIAASVANVLKVEMRSEPLLVSDLVWVKQIGLLLGFIDFSFTLLGALIILGCGFVYYIMRKYILKGKMIKSLLLQFAVIANILFFVSAVSAVFKQEDHKKLPSDIPIISKLNNWADINYLGFEVNARYKSLAFVWTKQIFKDIMSKPDGYSKSTISALYQKYKQRADEINETRTGSLEDETIIYLLSESFANPDDIEGISTSYNVIPNITNIKSQTTSGFMKSDFYGGGTANMEFQALTGLPFYNYSTVSTAYLEIVPKMSFLPSVSHYFEPKNRVVIHPSDARNYDRQSIYERLLFESLLFEKEIGKIEPTVGVYTSDEALYNFILDQIEPSESQFFSVISMQNHAPWSVNDPQDLEISSDGLNEDEKSKLLNFSRMLTYTDKATLTFLEKLKTIDKKVTVVFYGDHLPGLYPDSAFKKSPERKFMTDYFIWSNYQEQKNNHDLVNSSDFIAALLEHTNAKVNPYTALLTDVLNEASVDKNNLNEVQSQIAKDMQLIQYDISVGKGYILAYDDFFGISITP
ncbi:LTA synthase family protein [Streptococcus fryi]